MTIADLKQRKGELIAQADQILTKARGEGRAELSSDEDARFTAIHEDVERLSRSIQQEERQAAAVASLAESERRTEPQRPAQSSGESRILMPSVHERSEAMRAWFLSGSDARPTERQLRAADRCGLNLSSRTLNFSLPASPLLGLGAEEVRAWRERNEEHRAAMGTTSGAVGGYSVPDEAMRALEVSLLAFGGMRQVATVIRTDSGAALPIPTSDDTSNKGAILSENTQASEVDITFGQIVLDAYKYSSKYVLVSVELLQDSAVNVPAMIGARLGERIGRITNDHFTTGTGSGQPNGIVTAAGSGVTSTADPVTYDNVVDLVHSVDPAYRTNGKFMMSDAMLKSLKKIKVLQYSGDTTGVPLWSPGLAPGQPDSVLGFPYIINQSMAAPGSSAKKMIFGDLSKYLIRDVRDVTVLRLDERFADYHQVAFLAFSRHDGDLLDAGTDPVKFLQQS